MAEGNATEDILHEFLVFHERLGQCGFDEGWAYGVDADLVGREVQCHPFTEAFHRMFGGTVDGSIASADVAHLTRHIDDRTSASCLDHPPGNTLGNKKSRFHIKIEDIIEIVFFNVLKALGTVDAGIVDENGERPEFFEFTDFLHLGQIRRMDRSLAS